MPMSRFEVVSVLTVGVHQKRWDIAGEITKSKEGRDSNERSHDRQN